MVFDAGQVNILISSRYFSSFYHTLRLASTDFDMLSYMAFFSFKISACISKQILHSIKVAVLYSKHVETRQSIGPKKFITF